MKSEDEIKAELRAWVTAKAKKAPEGGLTDETPLIETRVISSMQVMELILFVEKLKGSRVNVKNLRPGTFRNVNSIYDSFFREGA